MAYARLGDEVFERQGELLCEEFRLYCIVFFHSYPDKNGRRVCRLTPAELCENYPDFNYYNLMRRLRRLETGRFDKSEKTKKVAPMKSAWIERTREGWLLPFVGLSEAERKLVNVTIFEAENLIGKNYQKTDDKLVKITNQLVKITTSDGKNYQKTDDKLVKITTLLKEVKKSLKKDLKNTHRNGVGENTPQHLSIFSLEECIEYARLCKRNDVTIRSATALGKAIWKTGDSDSLIQRALYPEPLEPADSSVPELTYEISEEERLASGLQILIELAGEGFSVEEQKQFYTEDEWEWLMTEMKAAGVNV